jgi:hypothetical protein
MHVAVIGTAAAEGAAAAAWPAAGITVTGLAETGGGSGVGEAAGGWSQGFGSWAYAAEDRSKEAETNGPITEEQGKRECVVMMARHAAT